MKTLLLSVCTAAVLLAPSAASATEYTICIRLPVTLVDETGHPDEIGTSTPVVGSGGWIARGIVVAGVDDAVGNPVPGYEYGFATHASTGCFVLDTPTNNNASTYTVWIRSRGYVQSGNRIDVSNSSGTPSVYGANISLPAQGGTFYLYWPNEYILPRIYAILARSVYWFRGRYNDEVLHAYWYPDSATNTACGNDCLNCYSYINGDLGRICIQDSSDQRKFLIAHEYGHANLYHSVTVGTNNCGYTVDGDPGNSWHAMRSLEYTSCAFHEGWANFVAADIWNGQVHDGGDPDGELRYWGPSVDVEVEADQGGCFTVGNHGDTTNFRRAFADNCWQSNGNCSSGNCNGRGVELDWMRTLWDFHTDGDLPGTRPDHTAVHNAIDAAGGWSSTNTWDRLIDGLSGSVRDRMQDAADWNGTSEP